MRILFFSFFVFIFSKHNLFAQCGNSEAQLTISIIPDTYPQETSWNLYANDILIASGDSLGDTICIDTSACIRFVIYDSYGDGICCNFGNGSYNITLDSNIIVTGGQFTSQSSHLINCVPNLLQTKLPIIVINTNNNPIPDEPKIQASMGIIWNGDDSLNIENQPFNHFFGEIGIETRGSSSNSFPAKSYSLETRDSIGTNLNTSIFNMPADNDWILYAPYTDKSLIRNVLTYHLGNQLGNYSPRTKMCELILNGEYQGVYVFMERIKVKSGRVNIGELDYIDTIGNALTGGYIFKIDKLTGGGSIAWISPYAAGAPSQSFIYFQLHDPELDTIHPMQLDYIQNYVNDWENTLASDYFSDPILGYRKYIDVRSFIDFMLVNELSKNVDGYRISTFLHKKRFSQGNKIFAGPLWDFNLAWGNSNYCEGGSTTGWEIDFNQYCSGGWDNPFWWKRFIEDSLFTTELACRWQELRQTYFSQGYLFQYIDSLADLLNVPSSRHFEQWPILGTYVWPNNFIGNTYQEEINFLKEWISDRLIWLDNNMFGTCSQLNMDEMQNEVHIFPNPTSNQVTIQTAINSNNLTLTNAAGDQIYSCNWNGLIHVLDVSQYADGIYLLNVNGEMQKLIIRN